MRVIELMPPPNGWHYKFNLADGREIIIHADSWPLLQKALLDWRLTNVAITGGLVGDVVGDLKKYICGLTPFQCQPDVSDAPEVGVVPGGYTARFIDRVSNWLAQMMTKIKDTPLIPQPDADKRAAICVQCSENREWREGCSACVENSNRVSILIRQGREADGSERLLGCNKLAQDNRTAVWLDRNLFTDLPGDLPDPCWLK